MWGFIHSEAWYWFQHIERLCAVPIAAEAGGSLALRRCAFKLSVITNRAIFFALSLCDGCKISSPFLCSMLGRGPGMSWRNVKGQRLGRGARQRSALRLATELGKPGGPRPWSQDIPGPLPTMEQERHCLFDTTTRSIYFNAPRHNPSALH